jgi:hypothetical protein
MTRHEPMFSGMATAMMRSRPTGPRPCASTPIAASVAYPLFQDALVKWYPRSLWPRVLLDRPDAALPDEGARHLVIDRPHRIADLPLHRLPPLEGLLELLHGRAWSWPEETEDLRVVEHGNPRLGIALLEGADDQARRLDPGTHTWMLTEQGQVPGQEITRYRHPPPVAHHQARHPPATAHHDQLRLSGIVPGPVVSPGGRGCFEQFIAPSVVIIGPQAEDAIPEAGGGEMQADESRPSIGSMLS